MPRRRSHSHQCARCGHVAATSVCPLPPRGCKHERIRRHPPRTEVGCNDVSVLRPIGGCQGKKFFPPCTCVRPIGAQREIIFPVHLRPANRSAEGKYFPCMHRVRAACEDTEKFCRTPYSSLCSKEKRGRVFDRKTHQNFGKNSAHNFLCLKSTCYSQ